LQRFLSINMNWTPELKAFIAQHLDDDTDRLLLSANRYPDIDVREAVEQICARRQIRNKLPEWYANPDVVLGGRVPAEQCSSEQTARYKRKLVTGDSLCDLTGGMGVDFYYMSQGLTRAIYTERQPHLYEAIAHNIRALGQGLSQTDFSFRLGDGRELPIPDVDTIYLDPARRASDGSRVYDIADCEPNVIEWQEELLSHCKKLIIKLSPMVDISRALQQLHNVSDVHIVAARNECKEVLVEMMRTNRNETSDRHVKIHCVDFRSSDIVQYDFVLEDEQKAMSDIADGVSIDYVYEPDVTILKAGAFKQLCADFGVKKLEVNSHFYSSEKLMHAFPGRCFKVERLIPFSGKILKTLKREIPQANVSARNFPLTADQIKSRSGIRDGGDVYLIATTIHNLGETLIQCRKAVLLLFLIVLTLIPVVSFAGNRNKKKKTEETITSLLKGVEEKSPCFWIQGRSFVYLNEQLSPLLQPEEPLQLADTISMKGGIWHFDSIVSEEDWMGQQKMQLRFVSPLGKRFRYNTERVFSHNIDTTYHPVLGPLQPLDMVSSVDSVLRARTLYILINDERIIGIDEIMMDKFVPVRIDSVTVGTEIAPLRVWFTQGNTQASFLTSLPDSREKNMSTTIDRYLSVSDPYLSHRNITKAVWELIQKNQIQVGMTMEEVRLSLGRPLRFERFNGKSGAVERWYYSNGRILEFWDGRFARMGRE